MSVNPVSDHPRVQAVVDQLDALEVDGFLVTCESNVRYLTGFTGDSTSLFVTRDRAIVLSDGRYDTQLAIESPDFPTAIRPPTQKLDELIAEVVGGAGAKRVAIEADHVSVSTMSSIAQKLENVEWKETSFVVETLRQVKDAGEIAIIRKSAEIAQLAFTETLQKLTTEMTEREFALELEVAVRRGGAEAVSFDIIAGFGQTGALPHYFPADRPLASESTILIDWGAKYLGYASDMTRTLHRKHASDEFRRAYEAVLEAETAAIEAIRPGVNAADIDGIARKTLEKHGLADHFVHSLGHGIGLDIHEGPRLAEISKDVLQPGMIVTVEPGVYLSSDFGIRIEDDVLVTEDGHELLTKLPKGLDDCLIML